jgi:hypothetical protein
LWPLKEFKILPHIHRLLHIFCCTNIIPSCKWFALKKWTFIYVTMKQYYTLQINWNQITCKLHIRELTPFFNCFFGTWRSNSCSKFWPCLNIKWRDYLYTFSRLTWRLIKPNIWNWTAENVAMFIKKDRQIWAITSLFGNRQLCLLIFCEFVGAVTALQISNVKFIYSATFLQRCKCE